MTRRKIRFVARDGKLVALYCDEAVPVMSLFKSSRVEYARFSHINPTPDGQHFQIEWVDEEVIKVLGESVTKVDGVGQPFSSKGQAERYEIFLLQTRYFKFSSEDKHDERNQNEGPLAVIVERQALVGPGQSQNPT